MLFHPSILMLLLLVAAATVEGGRQRQQPQRRQRRQQQPPKPQRLVSMPSGEDVNGIDDEGSSSNPVKPYWTRPDLMEVQVWSRPINEVVSFVFW